MTGRAGGSGRPAGRPTASRTPDDLLSRRPPRGAQPIARSAPPPRALGRAVPPTGPGGDHDALMTVAGATISFGRRAGRKLHKSARDIPSTCAYTSRMRKRLMI